MSKNLYSGLRQSPTAVPENKPISTLNQSLPLMSKIKPEFKRLIPLNVDMNDRIEQFHYFSIDFSLFKLIVKA
ncbi:hypothetical protein LEP1GSC047_1468 [Leptospira inadai serovar Lyme str. 10]|uniref:Uncharacterized protein n=1 Tax=Leptospira inadai serovar Lyme str. 10 TaxID=1049790 RepID=V6HH10_9LEPT|nr:hypothetical protein LEP1GSC047_1468 [Leptospira inadai serovar Lyme str. 10]